VYGEKNNLHWLPVRLRIHSRERFHEWLAYPCAGAKELRVTDGDFIGISAQPVPSAL
jgi:hypothetical protein